MENKEQSHFEPIEDSKFKLCRDLSHNAPMHLYIPEGQKYIHICPSCGKKVEIIPQQITF